LSRIALALSALTLVACSPELMIGEECSASADCMEGLSCFFTSSAMDSSVCMSDCDDTAMRLCSGGEVCIPSALMGVPREEEVCFIGGPNAVGEPCVNTFDCTRGSQCVMVGTDQNCYRACTTPDGAECLPGETCEALVGMGTSGYCATAP